METIQNMQSMTGLFGYNAKIRLPHVATDELNPVNAFFAELLEELTQGLLGSLFSNPQETPASGIDLIDHGQVLVPLSISDLVNPDGSDVLNNAMRKAPSDSHLDRSKDTVPGGLEDLTDLLPGQTPGPASKEPSVGCCQMILPFSPWNSLCSDAATRAIDPAHGVEEEHKDPPERDELKAALGKCVVARPRLAAAGTNGTAPSAWPDIDIESDCASSFMPSNVSVNKTPLRLDPIQDRLDQHPVFLCLDGFCGETHHVR
jgi:hypothetical protein